MNAKIDLNALKQLSKIELFLLLCGSLSLSFTVPRTLVRAEEPMPPGVNDRSTFELP